MVGLVLAVGSPKVTLGKTAGLVATIYSSGSFDFVVILLFRVESVVASRCCGFQ